MTRCTRSRLRSCRGATTAAERLVLESFDALALCIAVLDPDGVVLAVNEAWRRFARENGAPDSAFVGVSYLEACDRAAQGGEGLAMAAAQAIRELLAGTREAFALEYPCHSPVEERWFVVTGTVVEHEGSRHVVLAHENITERKRSELALQTAERTLRQVLETLPVGVWIVDAAGRIVHGNPTGHKIWHGARFVGVESYGQYKGWWVASGKPIAADEWAAARAIQHGETSIDEEVEIECFDGSRKVILNSAIPLRDADGKISGAIIVNQDISERHRRKEDLARTRAALETANRELCEALDRQRLLASTDFLTGVCNRRHFFELAVRELAAAERYHRPLSLILFDVDRFKGINDALGHQTGDEVLRAIANAAAGTLRQADVLARYGGEEFVVLLPETAAPAAVVVAEHLRSAIAAVRVEGERGRVGVTVSAGVAEWLPRGDTIDRLVSRADSALYEAKATGRDRAVVFSVPGLSGGE